MAGGGYDIGASLAASSSASASQNSPFSVVGGSGRTGLAIGATASGPAAETAIEAGAGGLVGGLLSAGPALWIVAGAVVLLLVFVFFLARRK